MLNVLYFKIYFTQKKYVHIVFYSSNNLITICSALKISLFNVILTDPVYLYQFLYKEFIFLKTKFKFKINNNQ